MTGNISFVSRIAWIVIKNITFDVRHMCLRLRYVCGENNAYLYYLCFRAAGDILSRYSIF